MSIVLSRAAGTKDALEIVENFRREEVPNSRQDYVGVTLGTDMVAAYETMDCGKVESVVDEERRANVDTVPVNALLVTPVGVGALQGVDFGKERLESDQFATELSESLGRHAKVVVLLIGKKT